jgi:leader peptidase (prepilin peptidase) / N-methyltransferase
VNAFLAWPFELRFLTLFLVGTAAGGFVNWAIYTLCWNPRPHSPWSTSHPHDQASRWLDRLPLIGWWRLRRKGKQLGYEFWVRPLLVEVLTGGLFAALYAWEIEELGLLFRPLPVNFVPDAALLATLHAQYAGHVLLATLLLAASFIDLDEQTIPDGITVSGTLLGLAWAACVPWSRLPDFALLPPAIEFLHLASPRPWPAMLNGSPQVGSLALGLGCYGLWCVALLPRVWRGRRGWRTAVRLMLARIGRDRSSRLILGMAIVGSAGIGAAWRIGGAHWEALLSALMGLSIGAGMIWAVRIVGGFILRREAMGFGDVTLLGMIGAFLGWQPALFVFFLAPFAGLVMGLVQFFIKRENALPYGPFLCLSTLVVIVAWTNLWDRFVDAFALGWLVPAALALCLVLMIGLLSLLALLRRAL